MKTIRVTVKKVVIIVGVIMGLLILLVFSARAHSNTPENDLRYKSEVVKIQQATRDLALQKELDCRQFKNKKLFKIYDDDENLLYQAEVNTNQEIKDMKLVKYLHRSDLVVNLNHTSFYRLSK